MSLPTNQSTLAPNTLNTIISKKRPVLKQNKKLEDPANGVALLAVINDWRADHHMVGLSWNEFAVRMRQQTTI